MLIMQGVERPSIQSKKGHRDDAMKECVGVRRLACLEDPNASLVEALKSRVPLAFDELVERYEKRLLRITYKMTMSREDAEDVVQNTFLQVYRNIARFRGECHFGTWITAIAINESRMALRKRKKVFISIDAGTEGEEHCACREISEPSHSPEQSYLARELEENLRGRVTKLRKSTRRVFEMHFSEELPLNEIARRLGLSMAAVKSRLFRARQDLQGRSTRHCYSRKLGQVL